LLCSRGANRSKIGALLFSQAWEKGLSLKITTAPDLVAAF
jgi:hypothetical protein